MDEKEFLPLPPRRRRPVRRARTLPVIPTYVWVVLGFLLVVWGLWRLREFRDIPQPLVPGQAESMIGGSTGAPDGSVRSTGNGEESASIGDAPPPALEPIDPVLRAGEQIPPSDTGLVGHPHIAPLVEGENTAVPQSYTVAAGDTLSAIATRFDVTVEDLMALNGLVDPRTLQVGQILSLPTKVSLAVPYQRLLPDSELILGPAYQGFDLEAFIAEQGGFLATYKEEVEGQERSGPAIVRLVSERYSVGPRPLLAALEYESGWVTRTKPEELSYPAGVRDPARAGLFFQLSWVANRMNEGYYNVTSGRASHIRFEDGTLALLDPETNPGTAAIQNLFAVKGSPDSWAVALDQAGYFSTYVRLFGDPWSYALPSPLAVEPAQPPLALPWPSGETWYFTGGPHGGWGDLSAWAALDFVPPDATGCQPSAYWATAAAAGTVIRSESGEVVIDLDGDGYVGTGWTLLYMHMAEAGRVAAGTRVEVGDPIGKPSCEGGFSDAAHLHIARRYDGQWIDAGGAIPFQLDGWQARVASQSYNGYLARGEEQREACACRAAEINGLTAP